VTADELKSALLRCLEAARSDLPREELPALIGELAAIQAVAFARIAAPIQASQIAMNISALMKAPGAWVCPAIISIVTKAISHLRGIRDPNANCSSRRKESSVTFSKKGRADGRLPSRERFLSCLQSNHDPREDDVEKLENIEKKIRQHWRI